MSNNVVQCPSLNAVRIELRGLVQGVGMRPFVARLANELGLCGFVRNDGHGVEVHAEGTSESLGQFIGRLYSEFPRSARVDSIRQTIATPVRAVDFAIGRSSTSGVIATCVPLDVAMCDSCQTEVLDHNNRRYQYPFTTCTDCGPRFSLIEMLPFDRERTSMRSFTICAECEREYHNPEDRRFHSQTNCCPACGPQIWFEGGRGWTEFAKEGPGYRSNLAPTPATRRQNGIDAIRAAAAALRNGLIVAMKGFGGYQLVCDATSQAAVNRLRQRKQRPCKPLAVMVQSIEEARRFADVSLSEAKALSSPENPIVLLPCRPDQAKSRSGNLTSLSNHTAGTSSIRCLVRPTIAPNVNPNLNHVGIMLPTSPLHLLLLKEAGIPCVITSGNRNGEPLAYQNTVAEETLQTVADVWLHHDRSIMMPIDDSVVRVINRQPVTIRAARGVGPMQLNLTSGANILAVGGQQKVALALSSDGQSTLGPYIGDMTSVASRQRFIEHGKATLQLYDAQPTVIVHDMHPDYFTTQWAKDSNTQTIAVQHHHAHIAAGMLEQGWMDDEVLGVAFDGTGQGTDGTIWGGEFLLCTATSFRRVARLRPFPLIGGERAVREPRRIAAALLYDAAVDLTLFGALWYQTGRWGQENACDEPSWPDFPAKSAPNGLLHVGHLSPMTSSMGRLFDGVASLLLNIDDVSYEGEAAMRLEAVCDIAAEGHYDVPIDSGEVDELDWRPMIRQIVADVKAGVATRSVAMKFVRGIAMATAAICRRFPNHRLVFSGGCFQNAVLSREITTALTDHPMAVGLPGRIPANDGGLAAGQLAVAAATLAASRNNEGVS